MRKHIFLALYVLALLLGLSAVFQSFELLFAVLIVTGLLALGFLPIGLLAALVKRGE